MSSASRVSLSLVSRLAVTSFALIIAGSWWPGSRAAQAAVDGNADSTPAFIVGTWAGTSTCVGNRAACRNETVVYRFSPVDGHPGQVHLYADKIVDGKRVPMGALLLDVDEAHRTVRGEFKRGQTHGEWSFAAEGDALTGRLVILPDRTVARDVKARRASDSEVPAAPPLSDYEE